MTFSSLFLKTQSGIITTISSTDKLVNGDLDKVYVRQTKENCKRKAIL